MEKAEAGGGTGAEEMILVYSHLQSPLKYPKASLSILVKTETGEVEDFYGGGLNSEERAEYLNCTKVVVGNVKKIVVGPEYGAALHHNGRLMIWKHTSFSVDSADCKLKDSGDAYRDMLAYCHTCGIQQRREGDCSSESIIESLTERTLLCHSCLEPHTTVKTWDLVRCPSNNDNVALCSSCKRGFNQSKDQIMNVDYNENTPANTLRANEIKDVAIFGNSICMLFENNLYIQDPLSNVKHKIEFLMNENSSSGDMIAVYGGGERQLFVKYNNSSLLKCSNLDLKNKTCLLKDVELPAAAEKVCCGFNHTAVLLNDGSVWLIKPDRTTYRLDYHSGVNVFIDIAVIANTDVYLVQAPPGTTGDGPIMNISFYSGFPDVIVEFYESALNGALKEMVHYSPPT